ncbi:MAG TPA: ATPase, T2SS/T4P/T4SS family [Candidatus Saccharimonadia bacterium]|nr:ATPase, T2SS/T4P/T4SS family [Candidatus Saccharimonadia bacterium]
MDAAQAQSTVSVPGVMQQQAVLSDIVPDPAAIPTPTATNVQQSIEEQAVMTAVPEPAPQPVLERVYPQGLPQTQAQSAAGVPSPSTNPSLPDNSILDVLLHEDKINQTQYDDVTLEHVNTGTPLETIIEQKNLVSEEAFTKARAKFYNIPFVSLAEVGSSPEALENVPEAIARRYNMFPFNINKQNGSLMVAMLNPMDLGAIDFLEKKTGLRVVAHFATPTDLSEAIAEKYAQSLSAEVSAAMKDTAEGEEEVKVRSLSSRNIADTIREAPIAKIVETILTFAVKARASDVHIEPQEDKTRVRYRIDGILHEKLILPKSVQDAVVSRIKILSELKIDEKRIPQDGRFTFKVDKEEVDLRISTLPTVHGEKIVMRLLKKSGGVPTLGELGLRGAALKNLEAAAIVPHGIVLVTGPTGSGKTTTLYSLLHKINTPMVNIMTLEDPVEYQMAGINQVQINPQAGLTFASGLRSFLRQDPNIIMVGEIRDKETAELAIQASLTGHLVFSTLHTNSAAGALPRLLDMEAEPFLLASSMTLVMAQRVVRQICDDCKEEYTPDPAVLQDFEKVLGPLYAGWKTQHKKDNVTLYRGKGCKSCGDSGYKGRIGIFEVLTINEKIGKIILERQPASAIEAQGIADGMLLMKQDGYLKALDGITTIEEVLRVAQI